MIDMGIRMDGAGGFDLDIKNPCASILNNIICSIMIGIGKWWFDPSFGSTLPSLTRALSTAANEQGVQDSIRKALQWLVDAGRIASQSDITIATERQTLNGTARIAFRVEAVQANGRKVTFSNFVQVV